MISLQIDINNLKCNDLRETIVTMKESEAFSKAVYCSFIADMMRYLHSRIPPPGPISLTIPAHVEIREEFFEGKNVKRAVVFLQSNGCAWALKSGHGCTMCGHLARQARRRKQAPSKSFVLQFNKAFMSIDFKDIPILNLFNNGSFFNDNEIPHEARNEILRLINKNKAIKKLVVETRPEFVKESVIQETKSLIPEKQLEIAIGLESADDLRRILAINKGFSLRQFARAADIILKNNVALRAYVLLKPPFYTEKEAIDDSINSINTAFSLGVNTVSLEPVTVQKYTLVDYLYGKKLYRLPWLWSVVEVIRECHSSGRLIVGLFKFHPSPEFVPSNCDLCNQKIMDGLIQYNRTLKVEVLNNLYCNCKKTWKRIVDLDESSFYSNLDDFINVVKRETNGSA